MTNFAAVGIVASVSYLYDSRAELYVQYRLLQQVCEDDNRSGRNVDVVIAVVDEQFLFGQILIFIGVVGYVSAERNDRSKELIICCCCEAKLKGARRDDGGDEDDTLIHIISLNQLIDLI